MRGWDESIFLENQNTFELYLLIGVSLFLGREDMFLDNQITFEFFAHTDYITNSTAIVSDALACSPRCYQK